MILNMLLIVIENAERTDCRTFPSAFSGGIKKCSAQILRLHLHLFSRIIFSEYIRIVRLLLRPDPLQNTICRDPPLWQ
jgi:hypothetical protein